MKNNTIGIAVVGTGFGKKVHIPSFEEHPRTQVMAVYHRDLEKAKAIAAMHKIPYACHQIEEIATLSEIQGVSLSTPPFLHYEMAQVILQAGKHLLLEKPTTLTAQEAKELYQLAATHDCVVTMDFEFRFIPAWQQFAALLAEGYVGKKRLIKIDWLVSSRADATRPWNWYAQREKGGGVLGAIGSHAFDYISWLFGPVKRLCGNLVTTIPYRPDPTADSELKPVDADDICTLMLELADGTPCQICLSSVTYQGRGHWIEVYGDVGTLVIGSDNQQDYVHGFRLWGSQHGEALAEIQVSPSLEFPRVYPDGRIAPFLRVIDQWVNAIDTEKNAATNVAKNLMPSLREGVYSQLLMDMTHESSLTGTWVEVPPLDVFLAA